MCWHPCQMYCRRFWWQVIASPWYYHFTKDFQGPQLQELGAGLVHPWESWADDCYSHVRLEKGKRKCGLHLKNEIEILQSWDAGRVTSSTAWGVKTLWSRSQMERHTNLGKESGTHVMMERGSKKKSKKVSGLKISEQKQRRTLTNKPISLLNICSSFLISQG